MLFKLLVQLMFLVPFAVLSPMAHSKLAAKLMYKQASIYEKNATNIMVDSKQPFFTLKLKSNPTTGYSWFLRGYDKNLIKPVKHYFQKPNSKLIGDSGFEFWMFKMSPEAFVVPQQTKIKMVYARPWELNKDNQQVIFNISTSSGTK